MLLIVKGAAFGGFIELQIVEEIVDDLAVLKPDLGKLAPTHLHDLVNVPLDTRVFVVHAGVVRVVRFRARGRLDAAKRGVVPMHGKSIRQMIITYRGKTPKIHPTAFIA